MRVALAHDWLTGMRGGEKVLLGMCELFPQADLFTLVHVPRLCHPVIRRRRVITSWLSRLPGVERYYRHLLPVMPWAVGSLDLRGYDLIVSSSHCVAKGLRRPVGAVHVCYCHSPMRYAWSQARAYRQTMGLEGLALGLLGGPLRRWDRRSADGVDVFVANSQNVADRIRRAYGRQAAVVYPPVDTAFHTPAAVEREEFYLIIGALAPYKRIDHAMEAMRRLPDRRLVVIGSGQMAGVLRRSAPPNVTFLGWRSDQVVRDHYRRAKALLLPGEEDFGIVPVEAMACGCPVIAYRGGGATETVLDAAQGLRPATGICYSPQTPEALAATIEGFERFNGGWDAAAMARHAGRFGAARFRAEINAVVQAACQGRPC